MGSVLCGWVKHFSLPCELKIIANPLSPHPHFPRAIDALEGQDSRWELSWWDNSRLSVGIVRVGVVLEPKYFGEILVLMMTKIANRSYSYK